MDTQSLKAFLAVAEQQSFSQAAEILHLTQSAVSKRIQQLELHLDASLFDRHNRTISLTEAGQRLLPKAHQILNLVADTELEIHNLSHEVSGKLLLATSHHIGLHRLPPILRAFTASHPGVQLDLSFVGSEKAYLAIIQRQVEVALTTLDDDQTSFPHADLLQVEPLWQDKMLCVCAPQHPLAQHKDHISLEQLANTPAILPEPNTITFQMIERVFKQSELHLYAPMPTNYLETIKMMVSVGMGWSMLPRTLLDDSLTVLNWPTKPIHRSLGLVYLKQRTLGNAAKAFIHSLLI